MEEILEIDQTKIGKWVEIELVDGKKWSGLLEEWDEDALYITNGNKFGEADHKGAECTSNEVGSITETTNREFFLER